MRNFKVTLTYKHKCYGWEKVIIVLDVDNKEQALEISKQKYPDAFKHNERYGAGIVEVEPITSNCDLVCEDYWDY